MTQELEPQAQQTAEETQSNVPQDGETTPDAGTAPEASERIYVEEIVDAPVEDLRPNPYQLREDFDPARMDELEESMKEHGQIHHVVGRWMPGSNKTLIEIGDGERRVRIRRKWGTEVLRIIVRDYTDEEMARMAIEANLVRAGNNPIELAKAYRRIEIEFQESRQKVADRVKKSRSVVSNLIRLLELPVDVQDLIVDGSLTTAHGLALLHYINAPRFVSFLAEKVWQEDIATKSLEKGFSIGFNELDKLTKAGILIQAGGYDVSAARKAHPDKFIASQRNPRHLWDGTVYCVDIEYHHQLVLESQEKDLKDRLKSAGKKEDDAPPNGRDGKPMKFIRSHSPGTYSTVDKKEAPTCSPTDECRAQCIGYGGETVEICTRPKTYAAKVATQTRVVNAAKRGKVKAAIDGALVFVNGARHTDTAEIVADEAVMLPYYITQGRSLAMMVDDGFMNLSKSALKSASVNLELHPDVFDSDKYRVLKLHERLDMLANMDRDTLLALGVEAKFRHDLERCTESWSYRDYAGWFSHDMPAAPRSWSGEAQAEGEADLDVEHGNVRGLIATTSTDPNFKHLLERCSSKEIELAIAQCEGDTNGQHKTRLSSLRAQLNRLTKQEALV